MVNAPHYFPFSLPVFVHQVSVSGDWGIISMSAGAVIFAEYDCFGAGQ